MISKITHIGIAVRGLEERLEFWSRDLGLRVSAIESVAGEKVRVALLPAGEARIELLEPTDESSAVAGYIAKRGEGIHHVAFEVRGLGDVVKRLRESGVSFVGEAPRPGAGGSDVAFIHPKSAGGVLVELVEAAAAEPRAEESIAPGAVVVLYLREPQEKLWGVLRRIDASGVVIEGVDLASFDDWVAQIDRNEQQIVGASVLFLPMGRVDKILLDRSSGELPSLSDRFERRTGQGLVEFLGG